MLSTAFGLWTVVEQHLGKLVANCKPGVNTAQSQPINILVPGTCGYRVCDFMRVGLPRSLLHSAS